MESATEQQMVSENNEQFRHIKGVVEDVFVLLAGRKEQVGTQVIDYAGSLVMDKEIAYMRNHAGADNTGYNVDAMREK